jgi:cyanate lyase
MEASGERAAEVRRLMEAKEVSGKTFSEIAAETGLTNVYVAQLRRRQAQLKADTVPALRAALPTLTDDLVQLMMRPPFRSYHPDIVHEPAIYRCAATPIPCANDDDAASCTPSI